MSAAMVTTEQRARRLRCAHLLRDLDLKITAAAMLAIGGGRALLHFPVDSQSAPPGVDQQEHHLAQRNGRQGQRHEGIAAAAGENPSVQMRLELFLEPPYVLPHRSVVPLHLNQIHTTHTTHAHTE